MTPSNYFTLKNEKKTEDKIKQKKIKNLSFFLFLDLLISYVNKKMEDCGGNFETFFLSYF